MNEHEERAGSSQPSVLGKVTFADGKPAVGFRVRALDCDLRAEKQVGAATTDATGAYEISYSTMPRDALTKPAADLRVQVLDAEGAALLTSALHPAAAPRLVVDLKLVQSGPEVSEYERLFEAIAPRLSGVQLADLHSEDIAYLASVTGQDARRIERLTESARCTGALNEGLGELIPEAVVYALLCEGLPAQAEALARVPQERVKEALERAVANNVIASPLEPARQTLAAAGSQSRRSNLTAEGPSASTDWQDDIAVVLREKRVERELVPSATGERLTVADLFANPQSQAETLAMRGPAARLSDEKLRRLAVLVAVDESALRQDWEKLRDQGFEAWEVGLVRRGFALAELTQDHLPMVRGLQDLGPVGPDASAGTLRYLAQMTEEDWQARVAETGVPARVEGIDDEARRCAYAAALERSVEAAFPTAVVAERVRQDRFAVESDLKTDLVGFFDGNPDFEFGKQYVQVVLGDGGEARTEGVADVDRLRQTLLGMERVIKITGNYREHSALLAYGFDSAHKVVLSNRRSFIDTMRTHPDVGAEAAAAIYDQAEHTTAVAATLLMRYRDPGINLPVLARTDLTASTADQATRASLREIPDLRTLFGSLDSCACEACLSVLSPAAYFVDLMRFLEGTKANLEPRTPTLPRVLSLSQSLAHSGADTSGTDGAYVGLDGSSSLFDWSGGEADLSLGDFLFSYSSTGSTMRLDVRFVLDGTPLVPVRVNNGTQRVTTRVGGLAVGSHRLSVEVRSVWVVGPGSPLQTTLSGNPTLQAEAPPLPPSLPRVLSLSQSLAHSGADTSGTDGAYVGLDGSSSLFDWSGGDADLSLGDFLFSYSSTGSTMRLDVRFVLDGTPLVPVRVDNGTQRVTTRVGGLAVGSHRLSVEVRSVWVVGPGSPLQTTLSGNPTLQAEAPPLPPSLPRVLSLSQSLAHSGADTSGTDGAYVGLDGSSSLFDWSGGDADLSLGDFLFSYSSTGSTMRLDVRFVLDGTPQAPVRVNNGTQRVTARVGGLAAGSHRLSVEVRSVWVAGPGSPLQTTLSGNPTLQAEAPPLPPSLPRVLSLSQSLAHSGANTSGADGAYVGLDGSSSLFDWSGGEADLSLGDFLFSYSSTGSTMRLDVRFVLDGTPLVPVRVDNGTQRVTTRVGGLAVGSHRLSVEVRSVWVVGPGSPLQTTLSGNPTLQAEAPPLPPSLPRVLSLSQSLAHSGADTSGTDGAYVGLDGSSSLFDWSGGDADLSLGDFLFSYSSTGSTMRLDVRFVLDGTPQAPVRVDNGTQRVTARVGGLAAGSHRLSVEVRSVWVAGPGSPLQTTLSGNPTLQAEAPPLPPSLPRVLSLSQSLAHSGANTSGADGAYAGLDGSSSLFDWSGGDADLSLGDFLFSYSSTGSTMRLDVRFVLDGTPLVPVRVDNGTQRVTTRVGGLAVGSHRLSVEVRSVWVVGPGSPLQTTLSGNPTLQAGRP